MKLLYTNNVSNWLHCIFPNTCVLCGSTDKLLCAHTFKNNHLDLCAACYQILPMPQHSCSCCATPLPATTQPFCGSCLKTPPPFTKVITPYLYQTPMDYLITKLKFHNQLVYAKILGLLLAEHLQQHYRDRDKPQIIIPIPLHKSRLRERGFNQSLEIAKPIAKIFRIPINKYECIRHKNTEPQSLLRSKERKENIHNAFSIKSSFIGRYEHVAMIDDVITTGDTVREFCHQLQRAGVQKIDVWACAHA